MTEQAAASRWVGLELELELAADRVVVGGAGAHSSLGGGMIAKLAFLCCQAALSF